MSQKNAVNPAIAAAQDAEIKQISDWVAEFYAQNATDGGDSTTSVPTSQGLGRQDAVSMYLASAGFAVAIFGVLLDSALN